ncbi:MAG: hypothetical protein GF350_13915 [Chitinivibrionales bacterium]|nr:hypothetical protein [Chitinivibrionales bacterium]
MPDSAEKKASVSLYYNKEITGPFVADPAAPFLISFPRTGSHWLRMVMELYFERPLLTRIFFYHEKRDFLALHTHDLDLDIERENVIYLYRDPVDTLFSYLRYYNEPMENAAVVKSRAGFYGRHLHKWLIAEKCTKKKTIVRFEKLRAGDADEFGKICFHFSVPCVRHKLVQCMQRVSKESVRIIVPDDPRVIDLSDDYDSQRELLRSKSGELIMREIFNGRESLREWFE